MKKVPRVCRCGTVVWLLGATLSQATIADTIVVDFENDEFGDPMIHGQIIDPAFDADNLEFGTGLIDITSRTLPIATGQGHFGVTVFDSDRTTGPDPDLQVGSGNILILQNDQLTTTALVTNPDVGLTYVTPDDEATVDDAGAIIFTFAVPLPVRSIDLVDIDRGVQVTVTLTDADGLTRTFIVEPDFTFDINTEGITANGVDGIETLQLDTLATQTGEGGGDANATEDAGFNPEEVVELDVAFGPAPNVDSPSGGLDNLVIEFGGTIQVIPEPASLGLVLGGLCLLTRRRPDARQTSQITS
ncbi:MAG: hypothetical protein AAF750_09290 [Planctomycetota bacterium]